MKIVVAGGRDEADFLIGLLLMGKHKLITVNEDMSYCEHLAAVHDDISVIYGDPCKEYVMEDAGIDVYKRQHLDPVQDTAGRNNQLQTGNHWNPAGKQPSVLLLQSAGSVSYTHLDVYKRQSPQ